MSFTDICWLIVSVLLSIYCNTPGTSPWYSNPDDHCNWAHFAARVSGIQIMGFLAYNPLLCSLSLTVILDSGVPVAAVNSLQSELTSVACFFQQSLSNKRPECLLWQIFDLDLVVCKRFLDS
ncbi:hypothetical protein CEXT_587871 [Caerostris extrusa]|uniref:Uncharacterized protein n=1 Tax=Caerostris extrusa TaxID=172846 RepID=A0AAV4NP96_CAEEX|nr:hypothetical protein CEXT_587871 [Caerostris extrusa]